MTQRESFISQMQKFANDGDQLKADFPGPDDHPDIKQLTARVALLRRWAAEAAVQTDTKWEQSHPRPGTWRYHWQTLCAFWRFMGFSRQR